MRQRGILFSLAVILMLSGCVWKSEYKAKLAEIEGLEKSKAGLEERLGATGKELADLKQKHEELTKQKEQLEKEKAALTEENSNIKTTLGTKRDQLSKEVVELKNRLSENNARIKSLEDTLAARSREIAELQALSDKLAQEKEKAVAQVKSTYDSLVSELKQEIKQGEVQITQLKDKLTVNMVEKILFDSGSAVIKKNGKKVLDRVAEILKTVKNQQIKIEGHTDNVPIGAGLAEKFPTNWELATARATTVVRYLQERGVNPGLLSAEGYSEYRPVAPNDTDENKSKNRRIEIVLIPLDVNK